MPLVCSTDVECPPDTYWRQCPAAVVETAASAATAAAKVASLSNASVAMESPASSGDAAGKKECRGAINVGEYDPATQQCCGEGTVARPMVCSAEKGCCPGGYTGYPECFDKAKEKCCGYNFATDMPLVCSAEADCPPSSYTRQCPTVMAEAAAPSSAAPATREAGAQTIFP